MAMELDPVFVRALRLLHSKSKDSTAQLKSMLDEAILRHRKGLPPGNLAAAGIGVVSPASPQMKKSGGGSEHHHHHHHHHHNRRESSSSSSASAAAVEKRNLDRLKHELSELVPSHNNKRQRLMDSPRSSSAGFSSKSHTPSPTPPGSRGQYTTICSTNTNYCLNFPK